MPAGSGLSAWSHGRIRTSAVPAGGGNLALSVTGTRITEEGWDEETLYRPFRITSHSQELKAIPYCLWNNRGQGEMAVWIHMS